MHYIIGMFIGLIILYIFYWCNKKFSDYYKSKIYVNKATKEWSRIIANGYFISHDNIGNTTNYYCVIYQQNDITYIKREDDFNKHYIPLKEWKEKKKEKENY